MENNIREFRKNRKLSQEDLAKAYYGQNISVVLGYDEHLRFDNASVLLCEGE